jgi:hypothetical protein
LAWGADVEFVIEFLRDGCPPIVGGRCGRSISWLVHTQGALSVVSQSSQYRSEMPLDTAVRHISSREFPAIFYF